MTATPWNQEHRRHILVVDDDVDNRELLAIVLTHAGYWVTCAEGGVEALHSIVEHAPDLILLDLMMPGMNGYEVTARIKGDAGTQHIIVILLSALSGTEVRARAREAGAQEFFTKPMGGAELCARVKAHLPH